MFFLQIHIQTMPLHISIAKELKLKVIINVMIKKTGLITIKINIYFTLLILQN